jgi:WD40 repeat protein
VTPPLPVVYLFDLAFSPDGGRVVTADADKTARVWDAETGEPLTPPLAHGNLVAEASFSADGRFVVTASPEGERVWEAATGRLLTVPFLPGRGTGWGRAVLTPDNRRLVSVDHDEYVRVWEGFLDPGDETAEELVLRARLVAGHWIDAGRGLVPLTPEARLEGWEALRARRKAGDHE